LIVERVERGQKDFLHLKVMMRKRIRIAITVLVLLGALTAVGQQFDEQAESQLVQSVNLERARAGLPSLKVDDRLREAARAHSQLMAEAKQLTHQLPGEPPLSKRLAATNLRFNNDAENVAYDYSVPAVHDGLMKSPPHRANILGPQYNTVGIGVVRRGEVYWVTEDFAHRLQEYSVEEAENALLAAWQRERKGARLAPVQVVRMPQLRRMACDMAQRGKLDSRAPLALPNVEAAVVYTDSEPARVPASGVKMAHDSSVKQIGVGACFAGNEQYPAGTWWVAMVFL
jgi:Cysteine-rich secretory protein family